MSDLKPIKRIPLGRYGNKQNEIKYFSEYLPVNVKNVIEPFAGTFAIIRNKYYDYKKYNLIISDSDEIFYNTLKNLKEFNEKLWEINEYIKNNISKIDNKKTDLYSIKETNEYMKQFENLPYYKNLRQKIQSPSGSIKVLKNKPDIENLTDLIKNMEIYNIDGIKLLKKYKDDKDTFIFCDPPYLNSDNSKYNLKQLVENKIYDNTYYYSYLAEYIKTCKCKILIVVNKNCLMEYIFKNYIKKEYKKIYGSNKITQHLVISNFNSP